MKSIHAFISIILLSAAVAFAEDKMDIEYGQAGGQSLLLDAHVPDGTGPFPVVIVLHGGGWNSGGKRKDVAPLFDALSKANFTWFTVDYRLSPTNRWPACFEDVQTAIRWVKAHAGEYKGDPHRVALLGYSAGGHLACLAAVLAKPDTQVQAVVGCAPPTDLVADTEQRGGLSQSLQTLFGKDKVDDELRAILKEDSPITYVKPGLPPFYLIHGDADKSVAYDQSIQFHAKLRENGDACELITLKSGRHKIVEWEKIDPTYKVKMTDWLTQTLGAVPTNHPPAQIFSPDAKVKIVLVGDSTVNDKNGWGFGFKQFLTNGAQCINTAVNGRSSKSFIAENRWTQAQALKGDYYLIQFGHNDEPGKGERSTDPTTTYRGFMTRYVDEARAIGAKPILVTSLVRRQFDKSGSGKITSSLVPYVDVVKAIAAEKNVPLIDLHARSKELCEKLGREGCLFFSPTKMVDGTNTVDNTHLNQTGSVIFARLVVEELRKAVPELAQYLRDEPDPNSSNATVKVFDVREFGAKGDGTNLDTEAIQKALDECGKAGGGIVRLTAGTYLSKPIFLRSRTTLQLDEGATLQARDVFEDFASPEKPGAVIAFVNGSGLTDIAISGKGAIDGAGARWWPPVREAKKTGKPEPRRRPRLVLLSNCVGVRVQDVTLQNSPSFHLVPVSCEDVTIEGVTIRAPADSPNTDAIDPSDTRHVRISKCVIDVGDDNVAIKSGHADAAHPNAACEDITVTDCTFLHGHGMSIGSETTGGVRDLTVQHCTFEDTTSGIRIKSSRDRGGLVENVRYSDITMKNVKIPINLACYYPRIPTNDPAQAVTSHTPMYRNIRISNLTATSPQSAGFIVGLPESVVSNVVLENVSIIAPLGLTVRNTRAIKLDHVKIEAEKGDSLIIETNAMVEGADAQTK